MARSTPFFPRAPNWYSSHALAASGDLVAYAAKNEIFLHKHDPSLTGPYKGPFPNFTVVRTPLSGAKVSAVDVFSPECGPEEGGCGKDGKVLLAATSGEGIVRFFRLDPSNPTTETNGQHQKHREPDDKTTAVTCCSWSPTDPGVLVSADERGGVVVWDTDVNLTRSMSFTKKSVLTLRCSPHQKDIVALGCKHGFVIVANVAGKGKTLRSIVAHSGGDITGLSWCPSPHNVFESSSESGDATVDPLFAVASKDRSFSIWSSTSGNQLASMSLARSKNPIQAQQWWSACCWVSPSVFLTGGSHAELLKWDLSKLQSTNSGVFQADEKMTAVCSKVCSAHPKILMAIASYSYDCVFTIGQDRSVVSYELKADRLRFHLPALASVVFCMATNHVASSVLAIGAGDNLIRVWRTSCGAANPVQQHHYMNGVKVTALAWHPHQEGTLAFGTNDGRVGVLDAISGNSKFKSFHKRHQGQVYNLAWGPYPRAQANGENSPVLYSVGDGKIFVERPDSPKEDLDTIVSEANGLTRTPLSRTELAFYPSPPEEAQVVAVGSEDGSVEVLDLRSMKILFTLKTFRKLIESLAWHPRYYSAVESTMSGWLAVASNENDIHVFDLSEQLKARQVQDADENKETPLITAPKSVLSGHLSRVNHLSWSHHEEGKLVSASWDNSAQVWDVKNGTPIANFSEHHGRVFCVQWSPKDPDVVFSGSEDCTLRGWRISEQHNVLPVKKVHGRKQEKSVQNGVRDVEEELKKVSIKGAKELASESVDSDKGPGKKVETKKSTSPNKKLVDDVMYLAGLTSNNGQKESVSKQTRAFLDTEDATELLLGKAQALSKAGKGQQALMRHLWIGEPGQAIREDIQRGRVTEMTINMAAATSKTLWKDACKAYAKQLEAEEDPMKAASYFLMADLVEDALQVLTRAKEFEAALCIAKCRLTLDSPLIEDILSSWAKEAHCQGNYEKSAMCQVALGKPFEASRALSRRLCLDSLAASALLAKKAGETDQARVLAVQFQEVVKDLSPEDKDVAKWMEKMKVFDV